MAGLGGLVPDGLDAGSTQNAGTALEWQPDIPATIQATQVAQAQTAQIMAAYEAQAAQFIQEWGAEVLGGHTPVNMGAENVAGAADIGGPGNPGTTDNSGSTTIGTVPPQG